MAKILLVEDDNNLREIYEARLQAEGYTIVSAHDGEEALVVAKAEKPELIISDVMMPKISGFEMLDILRNTDSLKGVKVIMLTALGQSDDQQRANKLGADRYLVKSQVTLEDIVNEANALLQPGAKPVDATMPTSSTPQQTGPQASTSTTPTTANVPVATEPEPIKGSVDIPPPSSPATSDPQPTDSSSPVQDLSIGATPTPSEPAADPTPTTTSIPITTPEPSEPAPVEPPKTEGPTPTPETETNLAETTSAEESEVKTQIEDFAKSGSTETTQSEVKTSPDTPLEDKDEGADKPKGDNEPFLTPEDEKVDVTAGYSPQPTGKKVIEPLPETESKPDINELLEREKAKELMQTTSKENPDDPPKMSAADTAPAPPSPVISPNGTSNEDPNNIAL